MIRVAKLQIVALAFLLIFAFSVAHKTIAQSTINENDINLEIVPEVPGPYEDAKINLLSYSADLNSTKITWIVDGKTALSGFGKKSFALTTKGIGEKTTIQITMDMGGSGIVSKTVIIEPGAADLAWEAADSYVPTFYKGRALPSSESFMKIVAMPSIRSNGIKQGRDSLIYRWKNGDDNMPDASGYAKSYFQYKKSYLNNSEDIEASVYASNGSGAAKTTITVPTFTPQIIFYENKNILGERLDSALENQINISGDSMEVVAEPYFFSPQIISSPDLTYNWSLNGSTIPAPSVINAVKLKRENGQTGTANLSLSIESATKLFLTASKAISVQF